MVSGTKPNVLVCGYTGSGKTSLLQAFCGEEVVPEDAIGHGEPETFEFHEYESERVRFRDSRGMEMGQREDEFMFYVRDFVRRHQRSNDVTDHIHILWYCIAGDRARVTGCDRTLIRELFPTTLVVVTKSDIMRPRQRKEVTDEILDAGVPEEDVVLVSAEDKVGLDRLLVRTQELMPRAHQNAFELLLRTREDEYRELGDLAADEAIKRGVSKAAGLALIPLVDLPLLVDNQHRMIAAIGACYGFAVSTATIERFLKGIGVGAAGMLLSRFIFPLKAPVAAGVTYSLGRTAQEWFRAEMKLPEQQLQHIYEVNRKQLPGKSPDTGEQ